MNPPPRDVSPEDRKLIDEWLAKNKATKLEQFARTDPDDLQYKNAWGKPKKKKT